MIGLNRRPVNGTSHDLSMRMHVLLRKIPLLEKMIFGAQCAYDAS